MGGFFFDTALLPQGWTSRVRVTVEDGVILAVTPNTSPEPDDIHEAAVLPGFPNVHSHAFQRAMAGLAERRGPGQDSFWTWREVMYRFLGRLDPDMVEAVAAYAYADMLEAGFTAVGEFHYLHRAADGGLYDEPAELALRHVAAAAEMGIGMTMLPVFYAHAGFGGTPPTPGQARFITDIDLFAGIVETCRATGTKVGVAPHSLRAVTPEELAQVVALADGAPIHIHAAEQLKEVEDCLAWSGQRPVEWLLAHETVDARWCLVHATHLTPEELRDLAGSAAVAGLCPITEANLGDGVFDAAPYLESGGRWGVGTDSNVSIDAAGELRQLEYAQRLSRLGRNVLATRRRPSTGRALLDGALRGGAQALGRPMEAIAPGMRADFVCLDMGCPDLEGRSGDELLDAWVFVHGRQLIDRVYAGGQLVVDGGRHRLRNRIGARYRSAINALYGAV